MSLKKDEIQKSALNPKIAPKLSPAPIEISPSGMPGLPSMKNSGLNIKGNPIPEKFKNPPTKQAKMRGLETINLLNLDNEKPPSLTYMEKIDTDKILRNGIAKVIRRAARTMPSLPRYVSIRARYT